MTTPQKLENLEQILSQPDIRYKWIGFQLSLCGMNHKKIAAKIGNISGQAVGQCIKGEFKNRDIESTVAEILQIPVEQLFSERYQELTQGATA